MKQSLTLSPGDAITNQCLVFFSVTECEMNCASTQHFSTIATRYTNPLISAVVVFALAHNVALTQFARLFLHGQSMHACITLGGSYPPHPYQVSVR